MTETTVVGLPILHTERPQQLHNFRDSPWDRMGPSVKKMYIMCVENSTRLLVTFFLRFAVYRTEIKVLNFVRTVTMKTTL